MSSDAKSNPLPVLRPTPNGRSLYVHIARNDDMPPAQANETNRYRSITAEFTFKLNTELLAIAVLDARIAAPAALLVAFQLAC